MKFFKIKVLSLFILVVASCQKDGGDNIRLDELTVWGYMNPQQGLTIILYSSDPVLSGFEVEDKISGADVKIYEDGVLWETLAEDENKLGIYYTARKPQRGKTYRMEAFKTGFNKVSAEAEIAVSDFEATASHFMDNSSGMSVHGVSLEIEDGSETGYYELSVYSMIWHSQTSWRRKEQMITLEPSALVNLQETESEIFVFSDEAFINETVTLNLKGMNFDVFAEDPCNPLLPGQSDFFFQIYLNPVSEDYYKYYLSLLSYQPPSQVYSNISRGKGIFFGKATREPIRVDIVCD